jgi:hypothetical protein
MYASHFAACLPIAMYSSSKWPKERIAKMCNRDNNFNHHLAIMSEVAAAAIFL